MEIGLSAGSLDFGTVVLGGTTSETSLVAYAVANGNYDLKVKSDTTWQGAGASIDLVTSAPGYGEFRLKSDDDDTEDGAISTSGAYQVIKSDASGPTADRPGSGSGGDQVTCGLWLTMGSEGIPAVTYQGTIFYQLINH